MDIRTNFEAPFGMCPELRCMHVSRWGIISMSRHQSVAEHSYNVASIVKYLCKEAKIEGANRESLVCEALFHDVDEIFTGDIPTPAKTPGGNKLGIIKLADCIEAYRYAIMYCNDTDKVKAWLLKGIRKSINDIIGGSDILIYEQIKPLMEDV